MKATQTLRPVFGPTDNRTTQLYPLRGHHDLNERLRILEDQILREKSLHQSKIAETVINSVEKERSRIGMELHDNINQLLSCAKLFYGQIECRTQEEFYARKRGDELLFEAIQEIRKLSQDLVLPRLTGKSLVNEIELLIKQIKSVSDITVVFQYQNTGRVISQVKTVALYRILQELLKNVLIHSKAKKVMISLRSDSSHISLIVTDDGIGSPAISPEPGIGLSNISERVKQFGGTCVFSSEPGGGFTSRILIPRKVSASPGK